MAIKIYRPTDRIPVRIGELTFWLAPLTYENSREIAALAKRVRDTQEEKPERIAIDSVRFSLRQVDGLESADGSPYELEFDPAGNVTEQCVNEMFTQLEAAPSLVRAAGQFALRGVGPVDLPGVEVDLTKVKSVKKNSQVPNPESC